MEGIKDIKDSDQEIKKLYNYRETLQKEAESIILRKFPAKVIEFNQLLTNPKYQYSRLPEITANTDVDAILPIPIDATNSENLVTKRPKVDNENTLKGGTPVYGFVKGSVKCNAKLAELMDEVRPLLREAVEDMNKVKIMIQFLIPKIEDGNNFGVSIQEECLNEVRNVEGEVAAFLDQMSRYFTSRARIITKIAKYPHVDDYRRAMVDTDEKQFINIRLVLIELRNHMATLHDLLVKNMEKIKKPRTSHVDHMMY